MVLPDSQAVVPSGRELICVSSPCTGEVVAAGVRS
jgi:hypothetical protein